MWLSSQGKDIATEELGAMDCVDTPLGARGPIKSAVFPSSGLLAALASTVVCFQAEVGVPSALSISCQGHYLSVGSGAAEAYGLSPWGWPGKLACDHSQRTPLGTGRWEP